MVPRKNIIKITLHNRLSGKEIKYIDAITTRIK